MAHPIHEANKNSPYGDITKAEFYRKHRVHHQESFIINKQGMKLFTQSWQPSDTSTQKLKAFVAMIHGYTSESSGLFELNAVALAKAGFFVCALDLQGHGFSQGPPDHITAIDPLVQDCLQYFNSKRADHQGIPHFLYGESLGGAIAILVCLQQKKAWKGLILSGAMVEVSTKFKPVWPLEKFLPAAAYIAPCWRVSVTKPPLSQSYKENWKRQLAEGSPNRRTCGRPTAATALQLLRVCEYIKGKCEELEVPMLILHGGDDVICDPEGAKYLYKSAGSKDKTLKIFEGMWHLLIGEPNDGVDKVFDIVLAWIEVRADLSSLD